MTQDCRTIRAKDPNRSKYLTRRLTMPFRYPQSFSCTWPESQLPAFWSSFLSILGHILAVSVWRLQCRVLSPWLAFLGLGFCPAQDAAALWGWNQWMEDRALPSHTHCLSSKVKTNFSKNSRKRNTSTCSLHVSWECQEEAFSCSKSYFEEHGRSPGVEQSTAGSTRFEGGEGRRNDTRSNLSQKCNFQWVW